MGSLKSLSQRLTRLEGERPPADPRDLQNLLVAVSKLAVEVEKAMGGEVLATARQTAVLAQLAKRVSQPGWRASLGEVAHAQELMKQARSGERLSDLPGEPPALTAFGACIEALARVEAHGCPPAWCPEDLILALHEAAALRNRLRKMTAEAMVRMGRDLIVAARYDA